MRRRTAALVLALLGVGVFDSHVDWETVDEQALININGARFDVQGWALDQVATAMNACDALQRPSADSPVGTAVLRAVAQHSPPDSANVRWHQGLQVGPWLVVELSFERLSPVVALLRREGGNWRLHPTAIWSGSTDPWVPGTRIRKHLRRQAPEAPEGLIACFRPLQDFRSPALLQSHPVRRNDS